MTKREVAILGLLAASTLINAQAPARRIVPAGVLVGVHHREDYVTDQGLARPIRATLGTIWLESDGAAITALPLLLVPRKSGFWWVGLTHRCAEEPHESADPTRRGDEVEVEDTPWASPVEAQSSADVRTGAEECQSTEVFCVVDRRTDFYWIWPDFISMNRRTESGCGAHPDGSSEHSVRRLEELWKPLAVGDVLGSAAEARLRQAFQRAKGERVASVGDSPATKECADLAMFGPTSWHIERKRGQWTLEGWSDTHRLCGYGIDYSAIVDLSRITGRTTPPPAGWTSISNAKDAFASPDGQWILLVRDTEVVLSARGGLDRPVARAPLSKDASVVMVEWAQDAGVARWRTQMRSLGVL